MNKDHVYLIKSSLEDNEFCFLENFVPLEQLPTWSHLIKSLNDSAHNPADFHVNDPFVETQINYAIRRGIGYFYSFFDNKDVHVYPFVEPIIKDLEENGLSFLGNSVFLSLFTDDDYAKPHKDEQGSSIYIQCEGTTTWRFHEEGASEDVLRAFILNPGDAVFFTRTAYHSVIADTPRASIVLRMVNEGQ